MFGFRTRTRSLEEKRQDAFGQLKPLCLPLLELARLAPTPHSTAALVTLLSQICTALVAVQQPVFTPALANYVFFPLSALLRPATAANPATSTDAGRRSDAVVEETMRVLQVLVRKWRATREGMDERVRSELWIMAILLLGGPLDPARPTSSSAGSNSSKGKERQVESERGETTQQAMLALLVVIAQPVAVIVDQLLLEEDERAGEGSDDDDDDCMGASFDWEAEECVPPTTTTTSRSNRDRIATACVAPASPPIPILFHTITTLTSLASRSTSLLALQITALDALHILIDFYLVPYSSSTSSPSSSSSSHFDATQPLRISPLVATALPGTASSLARIILSTSNDKKQARRQPSPVVVACLEVLSRLIVACLDDRVTEGLRARVETVEQLSESLEEIGDRFKEQLANDGGDVAMYMEDSKEEEGALPDRKPMRPTATTSAGPTLPTAAWLSHTVERIASLLHSLSSLSSHDSSPVRIALINFYSIILDACSLTLDSSSSAKRTILESLFGLSNDSWPVVASLARDKASKLLSSSQHQGQEAREEYVLLCGTILRDRFASLPSAILRGDEAKVRRSVSVIRAGLQLHRLVGGGLLDGIERWSWPLLRSLSFARVKSATDGQGGDVRRAWITSGDSFDGNTDAAISSMEWPILQLANLSDRETVRELDRMWCDLGKWSKAAGKEKELVAPFIRMVAAGGEGTDGVSLSAAWVLNGLLQGFEEGLEQDRRIAKGSRKVVQSVAKGVLTLLEQLEGDDDDEQVNDAVREEQDDRMDVTAGSTSSIEASPSSAPLLLVEHRKGASSLIPSLDALKPIVTTSATARALSLASHRILLFCLSLRLLSTTAWLLTTSFEPHLLQALYHLLSKLSPTSSHPLVREHAQLALARIAAATSHASVQNLLLDNVDYVINSVSQRLSIGRLDSSAPLVLVEMIRLVGEPIVPIVQDLVEDVLEALDDYHGYTVVTVGLWAVLDALMNVMVATIPDELGTKERIDSRDNGGTTMIRLTDTGIDGDGGKDGAAETDEEWNTFVEWFGQKKREQLPQSTNDDFLDPHPQVPFADLLPPSDDNPEDTANEEEDGDTPSDSVIPPTRSQLVAAQIIAKSLYFLTHPSPFLRAKVISLLANAVPLLCSGGDTMKKERKSREEDLLKVVHRAWPFILNRLSFSASPSSPTPHSYSNPHIKSTIDDRHLLGVGGGKVQGKSDGGEEHYVVLETIRLIRMLAEHVGSFMSRRIMEDVWPRFKALLLHLAPSSLQPQRRSSSPSIIVDAPSYAYGSSSAAGRSANSTDRRLFLAILQCLASIVHSVPVKEEVLFEIARSTRRFIALSSSPSSHHDVGYVNGDGQEAVDEIEAAANKVMQEMRRINGDIVWVVLNHSQAFEAEV